MKSDQRPEEDLRRIQIVRHLAATGVARSLRESARLSQSEVAAHLGVTPATVSRWEGGERRPRGELALKYYETVQEWSR